MVRLPVHKMQNEPFTLQETAKSRGLVYSPRRVNIGMAPGLAHINPQLNTMSILQLILLTSCFYSTNIVSPLYDFGMDARGAGCPSSRGLIE